jgi:outer membrane protease
MRSLPAGLLVAIGLASPVLAADYGFDDYTYQTDDQSVTLRGSIGVMGIEAKEWVYASAGSPNVLSYLNWQSVAPLASGEIGLRLGDGWTAKAEFKAALGGDSNMEDYDWFGPDFVSYNFDDWTHRSISPNTNLDWYLDGTFALGLDLVDEPDYRVNFSGGVKYTDVQWTASGGTYDYSGFPGGAVVGFRGNSGTLPDGPGITYRQQLPSLFGGVDVEGGSDGWNYAVSAKSGFTLMGFASDDHWLRSLHFVDMLQPAPMLSASANIGYDFTPNFGVFVQGGIEKVFLSRGDTDVTNTSTGAYQGRSLDTAGGELGTINLSAGLKGSF